MKKFKNVVVTGFTMLFAFSLGVAVMFVFPLISCGGAGDYKDIRAADFFGIDQLVIDLPVKKTTIHPSHMFFSEGDLQAHKDLVDAKNDDKTAYVTKIYGDKLFIQKTTQYVTTLGGDRPVIEKLDKPNSSYYIIFKCASNSYHKFYITSIGFPFHLMPDITCEYYLDKTFEYGKPYAITSKADFMEFYKTLQEKTLEQVFNRTPQEGESTPFVKEISDEYIITYGAGGDDIRPIDKLTKIEFGADGKSVIFTKL